MSTINFEESYVFEIDCRVHDDEDVMDAVNNELIEAGTSNPNTYGIFKMLETMKGKSQSFWDWVDDKFLDDDDDHEQAWMLAGSALGSAIGWEPQDHFVERVFDWAQTNKFSIKDKHSWKRWKKDYDENNYIDFDKLVRLGGTNHPHDFREVEVSNIQVENVLNSILTYDKEVK